MYEFEYQKPASLDDVTRLLGDDEAKLEERQSRVVCDRVFDQDECPAPDGRDHEQ